MAAKPTKQILEVRISPWTILLIIGIFALGWVVYQIADFLILLFASGIVAAAVAPFVRALENRGLPRWAGVLVIYLGLFAFIALALILVVPTITSQAGQLLADWPKTSEGLQNFIGRNAALKSAYESLSSTTSNATSGIFGNVVNITTGFINGIVSFVIFLVLTFYMLVHGRRLARFILSLIPERKQRDHISNLLVRISEKMGFWFRGQLLISLSTFFVLWIALSLLGVRYALTLALIGGLAEFIPLFGSWIGATPAVLVALGQSPALALVVGIVYLVWQNFQSYVISPQIMRQMLGVPSIFVLIMVLVLAKLIGFVGVFLAAPIAAALGVIAQEYSGSVERSLRRGLARAGQQKS